MIEVIYFDWFNTLACYDPPREELHSYLLREFSVEASPSDLIPGLLAADKYFFDEAARAPVSKGNSEKWAECYIHYANIMLSETWVKVDGELVLQIVKKWSQLLSRAHFVLFDDVLVTLKTLKERGLILGLLTSATKNVIAIHRELGLEPYLDFVVTSEEVGADKPDSSIFQAALQRAGVNASKTIHVGAQYKLDVVGARGVGIPPILIDRYDLYSEIIDCPRIRNLTELTDYL